MTTTKCLKDDKEVTLEDGKSMPKEKSHNSPIGILSSVWVCITTFFMAGCATAATVAPATVAPAPAAPATAVPTQAAIETSAPLPTPTSEPIMPNTPLATAAPQNDTASQLAQIDALLRQQMIGSIAYNKPASMTLGQTATIELLLNPSLSEQELGTRVTESGTVATASVEITPQMKAVLLSPLAEAFTIQPIHEEIQLVSGSETTKWSWFVTAKQGGTQKLVLVIYRLVKFEGQEFWREVQTYKADIDVKVTFAQWILSFDWKWIISIVVALLSIPFVWRWSSRRKRQP